jgi:hypothetical protein
LCFKTQHFSRQEYNYYHLVVSQLPKFIKGTILLGCHNMQCHMLKLICIFLGLLDCEDEGNTVLIHQALFNQWHNVTSQKTCIFTSITAKKSDFPIHIHSKSSYTIIIFNSLSSSKITIQDCGNKMPNNTQKPKITF